MLAWSPDMSARLPWCERKPEPNTLTMRRRYEGHGLGGDLPCRLGGGDLSGLAGAELLDVERQGGGVEPPGHGPGERDERHDGEEVGCGVRDQTAELVRPRSGTGVEHL